MQSKNQATLALGQELFLDASAIGIAEAPQDGRACPPTLCGAGHTLGTSPAFGGGEPRRQDAIVFSFSDVFKYEKL